MALGQQAESNVSMRVGNEHVADKTILDLLSSLRLEFPLQSWYIKMGNILFSYVLLPDYIYFSLF